LAADGAGGADEKDGWHDLDGAILAREGSAGLRRSGEVVRSACILPGRPEGV
jgi:hypothetical protein